MAELTAIGPEPHQRWQNPLPDAQVVRLGRAPRTGWKVPWDIMISREHAELTWQNGQLKVQCLETARNLIQFKGEKARDIVLRPGESFEIGNTRFLVSEEEPAKPPEQVAEEHSFSDDELHRVAFSDASHQMEIIAKLPHLMATARTDEEFAVQLAALLLQGMPHAEAAAVVRFDDPASAEDGKPSMMRWDSRNKDIGRFNPSRRLLYTALVQGKSMLHIWTKGDAGTQYTLSGNLDWAICARISGEACKGWCVYVTGMAPYGIKAEALKGDVRFTELLAQFIGAIRQVRQLEKAHAGMSQFFSPAVLETLNADVAATLLSPKEGDITVIFCDVRGFSKMTESAGENLFLLLARVSEALSVMTKGIVKYDGIIADFQGDAALGFWGWPVALIDGPLPACDAALAIYDGFKSAALEPYNALKDFQVGIGIAHGRAIAGMIGSTEQSKVGVFGAPVNLGSRLEGMTKQLGVPILIDEATAEVVRGSMLRTQGRCRRVARVRPCGMEHALMVSELLPPETASSFTDENILSYEAALDAFILGDWQRALEALERMPYSDGPVGFLRIFMMQHNNVPPPDWDGVIPLDKK